VRSSWGVAPATRRAAPAKWLGVLVTTGQFYRLELPCGQVDAHRFTELVELGWASDRNQPKADIEAIALTLVKLSQLIVDVPEIVEEHLINGRVVERLALLKVPSEGTKTSTGSGDTAIWEA